MTGIWFNNEVNMERVASAKLEDHMLGVESLAFTSDSKGLFSASLDRKVLLWDTERKGVIRSWEGDSAWHSIAMGRSGLLACVGAEGLVKLIDPRASAAVGVAKLGLKKAFCVKWRGEELILAGSEGVVELRDARGGLKKTYRAASEAIYDLRVEEEGITLASVEGELIFLSGELNLEGSYRAGEGDLRALATVGRRVFASSSPGILCEYERNKSGLNQTKSIHAHMARINCLEEMDAPGAKMLVSGSRDATSLLWNLEDLSFRHNLVGPLDQVACAKFSPDAKLIALASWDTNVYLYSAA